MAFNQTKTYEYNRRVSLQSYTESKSVSGQVTKSWTTYATIWAKIRTMSGTEKVRNDQPVGLLSMEVTIRYSSDVSGVSVKDRILYGSDTFDIKNVRNVDEQRIEIRMLCTQVQE